MSEPQVTELRRRDDRLIQDFVARLNRQEELLTEVLNRGLDDSRADSADLRRVDDEIMRDFRARLDKQDQMLTEIRIELSSQRNELMQYVLDSIEHKRITQEMVTLYKGSRMIIPALAAIAAALGGLWAWGKDHLILK